MTKYEIIKALASRSGLTNAEAKRCINNFLNILAQSVQRGERVCFPGFGAFHVKRFKARPGRNPQTGAPLYIPAQRKVVFIPGPDMRFPAG